ncbi:MAG: LPS export ABC transporter periplasmic protein LptC [Candidatus Eremiobacteraeota bacterium]|nr:LPS export ABC transporter periplasmic protein LptC [Candidatus Eremiobacteraeota bacterium]
MITLVILAALATPLATASPTHGPRPRAHTAPSANRSGAAAPVPASFDLGVWTVHASSLDANFKNGDFSTPDKVVMTRSGGDVSADRANGNYKQQVLYLNGHVVVHDTEGSAQSLAGGESPRASSPSTLTADKAQIDGAAKLYKAIGNVHYVQADTVVNADTGTLNDADHTLFLEGGVHITQGARSMTARQVLYNTATGTAHAEGDVTMQFPSEMRRRLATPRPLKIPKNGLTRPVSSSPP